ncbi:MAG: hypothetical protein ACRDXX_19630 [Stackebrandtia sp.]
MSDDNGYAQLLHELDRLRSGDVQANADARRRVEADSEKVAALRSEVDSARGKLVETAGRLEAPAPDLLPEQPALDDQGTPPPEGDLDAEVAAAYGALGTSDTRRDRALRAAQLPPLLPRSHAFVRNFLVYGTAMAACLVAQTLMTLSPVDVPGLWLAFMPPVVFLIAGYVATGVAGSPRLPMLDDRGRVIEFAVKKSPRLGAALAVITILVFLFVVSPWARGLAA